jgi:hypothetical protein
MTSYNIFFTSTSEYLCVDSESWVTKWLFELLTTKHQFFISPKATVYDAKESTFWFIISYGQVKYCKIIGFNAVDMRKKLEILNFLAHVVLFLIFENPH